VTDKNKSVGRGKETSMFLRELFRTGGIDKIGESLVRDALVDNAVFRPFVCVFRFFWSPPAVSKKAVEKGEKGCGGGAWECAPFGAGLGVHVDPFANRGKKKKRENIGSCANVYRSAHDIDVVYTYA